jgi:hypothetical protein
MRDSETAQKLPQFMPQILAAKCQPEEHTALRCVVAPGERSPLTLSSFPSLPLPPFSTSPYPRSFPLFDAQVSAAIEHAEVVVAVTARARKFAPPSIYPRDLESIVASLARERERRCELGESRDAGDSGVGGVGGVGTGGAVAGAGHGGKGGLAVMFGSERSGLTSGMPVTVGLLYLDTRSLLPRH